MLGAAVGATLVWLDYLPHWKEVGEADVFLYGICDSQLDFEFGERNCRDVRACVCAGADLFEESGGDWTGQPWALPRGSEAWEIRLFARGHDRLCD